MRKLTGSYFDCYRCGKAIYRNPSDQKKAPLGKFLCSNACKRNPLYPQKKRARRLLNHAVLANRIERPELCQRCGNKGPLQAHHHDYDKPLDVEWLCRPCHDIEHYQDRVDNVESRRKHFAPCLCGKKAVCRDMCKSCHAKWRKTQPIKVCNVPDCDRSSHARGLCNKHRQDKYIHPLYADISHARWKGL